MASSLTGKAQTVLGAVSPDTLGIILPHEHVLLDYRYTCLDMPEASQKGRARDSVALHNLNWVHQNWASSLDNLAHLDEDLAIRELLRYRRAGGGTVVDASSIGLSRDPRALARISRAAGLHIIMGSGYYLERSLPFRARGRSAEEIAEEIERDIWDGVNDTGIKAGVIGEIGCSSPWAEYEKTALKGACLAQRRTGAPLLIHPPRHVNSGPEVIAFIKALDVHPERVIVNHCDRTFFTYDDLKAFAKLGCYVEFDLTGREVASYPWTNLFMPNDGQRTDFIVRMGHDGFLGQVLFSMDMGYKMRLTAYGGHGFAHIINTIAPMLRRKGFSAKEVDQVLVENPKRALTFR